MCDCPNQVVSDGASIHGALAETGVVPPSPHGRLLLVSMDNLEAAAKAHRAALADYQARYDGDEGDGGLADEAWESGPWIELKVQAGYEIPVYSVLARFHESNKNECPSEPDLAGYWLPFGNTKAEVYLQNYISHTNYVYDEDPFAAGEFGTSQLDNSLEPRKFRMFDETMLEEDESL